MHKLPDFKSAHVSGKQLNRRFETCGKNRPGFHMSLGGIAWMMNSTFEDSLPIENLHFLMDNFPEKIFIPDGVNRR